MGNRLVQLDRVRRITQTLVRHGLFGLVDQLGLADRRLVDRHAPGERTAARIGRRLTLALDELGPTFVKLGQFLSTREDLIPVAMARELAVLRDDAATLPVRVIRRRIVRELGIPVDEAFAWFDDRPLAAASIAQVHAARMHDGRQVVVKVRRPRIRRTVEADLVLLRSLALRAASRSPEIARFDPGGLVDELAANLRLELDFEHEAECLRRMRRTVGTTALVPRVVQERSAARVLTMERIDGVKLSFDGGVREADARATARAVVACFATQYLAGELFHADPHEGNLMYTSRGGIALLDLGAVGEIDPAMRRNLLRAAAAASRRDGERLAEAGLAMAHAPDDLDRAAYRRDLGRLLDEALSRPVGEVRVAELVQGGFEVARRHRLRFRSEYVLFFRSAMLVDGLIRSLDPTIDPIRETRRHIVRNAWSRRWRGPASWLAVQTTALRLRGWLQPPAWRLGLVTLVLAAVVVAASLW